MIRILFFLLSFSVPLWSEIIDVESLADFSFGQGSSPAWTLEQKALASTIGWKSEKHASGTAARIDVLSASEKERNFYISSPVGKTHRFSKLRLRLSLRSENLGPDDAIFSILESGPGRGPKWISGKEALLRIPPSSVWSNLSVDARLSSDTTGLTLYVRFQKSVPAGAVLWIDKLAVEGLSEGFLLFKSEAKGNVFEKNEALVHLEIPPGRLVSGTGTVRDEYGNRLWETNLASGSQGLDIPLSGKGYYQLSASAVFENGTALSNTSGAALIGEKIPDTERLASPFGFFSVQNLPQAVSAGAGWNRNFIWTPTIEKTGNGYTNKGKFVAYDKNQHWIGCLWVPPKWLMAVPEGVAPGSGKAYPPKDWEELASFCKFVAADLTNLEYLEVMNEPDAGVWKGTDEELVRYHTVVAKAVKSVRPGLKVLGPSLYSIRIPALTKLVKLGLLEALDGLVIHAYVNGTPPEEEFIARIIELKRYLASIGKPDFPIYLTEFGWTTAEGTWQKPVDELTQARYAVRSMTLLAAQDIAAICYFCLLYPTTNPGEHNFSILRSDESPKPALAAYANLTRRLAGAERGGHWVRLSPDQNLALFKKPGKTAAVIWDAQKSSTLSVKTKWENALDMMGRPLRFSSANLTVGPSPIFLDLPELSLNETSELPPIVLMRQSEGAFPFGEWIASGAFALGDGKIKTGSDLESGRYMILVKSEGRWRLQPVEVTSPITAENFSLDWPLGKEPSLALELKSSGNEPVSPQVVLKFSNASDRFAGPYTLKLDSLEKIRIPLGDLEPGRRYSGKILTEYRDGRGIYHSSKKDLDLTLVSAPYTGNQKPDWEKIPVMNISKWSPFKGSANSAPFPVSDCSAKIQFAWGEKGLTLRAEVRDDAHLQNQAPAALWQGDSLQIGIDVDVDQPWQPNSWKFFNGHRVFEYGIALGEKGPMNFRWISYSDLPGNISEERLQANLSREGTSTRYEVLFPWQAFGLTRSPERGSCLGISVALNDFDGNASGRHGLRLFGGVIESKDPTAFGKIHLR